MRYITIQTNAHPLHPYTKEKFPDAFGKPIKEVIHVEWIMDFVLSDARMMTGLEEEQKTVSQPVLLKRSIALVDRFLDKKPGDVVIVDDEDWRRMKAIVDRPSRAYINALLAMQLVTFSEAIVDAPDTEPVAAPAQESKAAE